MQKKHSGKTTEIILRFLAEPTDINLFGKVHGGAVMKWIDQAGYVCATGWCGLPCVTVYVGGIRFHKPILIGNLVEVRARLVYTGKTSMHMRVEVRAADPKKKHFTRTTQCTIVFVAIDDRGRPVDVPKWEPCTPEEKRLEQAAIRFMESGKQADEEMVSAF